MKNKKTQFRIFTVGQFEKEQTYLQTMHQKGWKFKKLGAFGYQFEKCTPEDMIYQIDFHSMGSGDKEEYLKLFDDCGWEYIYHSNNFIYFRKPVALMTKEEGIFCDDASRFEMIKNLLKQKMCLVGFLGFLNLLITVFNTPEFIWIVFICFIAFIWLSFRYWKYKKLLDK